MAWTVFLVGIMIISIAGCEKWRSRLLRPSHEGVTLRSKAQRMYGYEQTVMIKASVEEVKAFLTDPDQQQMVLMNRIGKWKGEVFGAWPDELGSGVDVEAEIFGLELEGKMFMVKYDAKNYWTLLDNPFVFTIMRWMVEPGAEGCRLTLWISYEIPGNIGSIPLPKELDFVSLSRKLIQELDFGLAGVQAHFDPSLRPEELTAHGLRGSDYESMAQVYEAEVWMDARPEEVMAWVAEWENFMAMTGGIIRVEDEEVAGGFLERYRESPSGIVIHAPGRLQWGMVTMPADFFALWQKQKIRLYIVAGEQITLLETRFEPAGGGTLVHSRMVVEMPSVSSPELVDLMLIIAGLSEVMERSLLTIKEGVEGAPPGGQTWFQHEEEGYP